MAGFAGNSGSPLDDPFAVDAAPIRPPVRVNPAAAAANSPPPAAQPAAQPPTQPRSSAASRWQLGVTAVRPDVPAELLAGLTASQQKAVRHFGGPSLVLAGPGSGKTRVITRRIAALLAQGVPPYYVLAVTFTNKAAAEMRERVSHVLGEGNFRGVTVCTFHSLCVRLLRRYAEPSGLVEQGWLKADFTIIDSDDQSKLVKEAIKQAQLSTENFPPRNVLSAISASKNQLLDENVFAARATDFHGRQLAKAYKNYQYLLRKSGAVDFDDLLLLTVRLLATSDRCRADIQDHYRYLLVDEYQDTNAAQFLIAALIAGDHILPGLAHFASGLAGIRDRQPDAASLRTPNIMVVGDPDQSIYGWRGADINNILDFEKVFPKVQVIPLGENFRSRDSIITVADRLIKVNTQRKHKPLIATRPGGSPIEVVACRDEHHEARLVADWAQRLKEEGLSTEKGRRPLEWKDIAVFYRTNALSRVVEDSFRRAGVPYHLVRGTAFFQREEVKNTVAYLRLIANPADAVSLERIINTPSRGISDATFSQIQHAAAAEDRTEIEILRSVAGGQRTLPGLSSRAVNAIARFLAMIDTWRSMLGPINTRTGEKATLRDLVEAVVMQSGLRDHYSKDEEDAERLENIIEVINAASEFEQGLATDTAADPDAAFDAAMADALAPDAEPSSPEPAPTPSETTVAAATPVPPPEPKPPEPATDLFGNPLAEADESGDDADDNAALSAEEQAAMAEAPDFLAMADGPATPSAAAAADGPGLLTILQRYLEQIALTADSDALNTEAGAVQLMTLHAAKGLEFPAVAMIGLEHGMLPHFRATQSVGEQATKDMEEERRLCFVGITRAMDRLLITRAAFRSARGFSERTIPSQFLDELRGSGVEFSDQADPFGDASDDHEMHDFLDGGSSGSASGRPPSRPVPGRPGSPGQPPRTGLLGRSGNAAGSGGSGGSSSPAGRPAAGASSGGLPAPRIGGASVGGYTPGDLVRHPQFGDGKVLAVYPGTSPRVTVLFKAAGTKTLVLEYARITRIG